MNDDWWIKHLTKVLSELTAGIADAYEDCEPNSANALDWAHNKVANILIEYQKERNLAYLAQITHPSREYEPHD